MKKLHLLKMVFLLCALIVGSGTMWATDYVKVTSASDLVSGEVYVIAEISDNTTKYLVTGYGSKLTNTTSGFSVSNNTISTSTATPLEFTLGTVTSGNNTYYTLQYGGSNYIGYKGSGTDFETATATTNTKEQWSITPSSSAYRILNVSSSTRYIGRNGSNIGAYSTSNSYPNCYLFKKQVAVTSLTIGTAPTKLNYKVGETLDLTGLVLNADGKNVTSGYTAKIGETTVTSGTTELNEVGAKTITFTYGGKTCTQVIHVGELQSIAITTAPTKTVYNQGQTFDPTGMVVKATFSDEETTATTWQETIEAEDYDVDPSGALNDETYVTISYTWNNVEKTATQNITVNAATAYTVTFNAGTGSCATASLTEATGLAGVTLPTATIGITGWAFAGWATASQANTTTAPTLYAASSTYHPTENCTLYAVYKFGYKSETTFTRATSVSDITSADKVVIAYNDGKVLNTSINLSTTLLESDGKVTPNANAIFSLSGDNTDGFTLTNGTNTIGTSGSGNSLNIALSSTNNLWTFSSSTYTTNVYHVNNVNATKSLEVYNSAWKAYALTQNGEAWSMRVYVPATDYVYNSNPAAMINPSVAFTTPEDKSLYVQDNETYDNPANVTGISKAITYTSSDETVATITSAGVVTAKKAGTTTIKATVAAEVGVNTKAEASYVLTVKDAFSIAGLKAIDNTSGFNFVADLTNAVVTYVKDDYAYIQDAYAAIMVKMSEHGLTAGQKINGAISGTVKITNKIDQLTNIDLDDADVTDDGVIPSAATVTLADIKNAGTTYDGKLVTVTGATVSGNIASDASSGASIKDGSQISSTDVSMNLYAPNQGVVIKASEQGDFTGFISIYNAETYRLNIFEQSQISLTRNAPTDQPLAFASDAVELDEDTPAYTAFAGQEVSGAQGTVTYSIDSDDDGVVTSINSETGAVVLSGEYGTATIKASAAAKEVTVAGVTTPYNATTKTYTITVHPRYSVSFFINGVETILREVSYGAGVTVPTPTETLGDYTFRGWNTSAVSPTDTKPAGLTDLAATFYPEDNDSKYYAVYAKGTGTPVVEHTSTFTVKQASAPSSPFVSDGSSWTWSSLTFANDASACIQSTNGSVTFTLPSGGTAKTLKITKTSNTWAGAAVVVLKDASSNSLNSFSLGSSASATYEFTSTYDHSTYYTLTNTTGSNAWVDNIEFKYTTGGIVYSDYRTSLPTVEVTITDAKYATFCYATELSVAGTDVTAYTAKANGEGEAVTLNKITDGIIPAGEGVILYAASAGTYEINTSATSKAKIDGNELVGVLARTQIPETAAGKTNYIFSKKNDVVGFYKASGAYLLPNRSYLSTSTTTAAREFMEIVLGDGDATGIDRVEKTQKFDGKVYNLNGQVVENPGKGLYIVNGKKVVIR